MTALPEAFEKFLNENGIDPMIYERPQSQYFTINYRTKVSFEEIQEDFRGRAQPVHFCSPGNDLNFYKIIKGPDTGTKDENITSACKGINKFYDTEHANDNFRFATSKLYQQGKILPMDLSSGLAVWLLNLQPTDHVLDLCCAPGSKLILASWLLRGYVNENLDRGWDEKIGTITGVDVAGHRLAICRAMMKKYKVEVARLFCTDGTSFNEPVRKFDCSGKRRAEANKSVGLFHESTAFRKRPTSRDGFYDKVLVDAQCTHDGSIKHIRKHRQTNWKDFDASQFDPKNLTTLHTLQLALLENGFKMVKPGGIVVYSTCSLSRGQNEEIIEKFMEKWGDSVLPGPFENSDERGQLRMCPPNFDSGFFICRLIKKKF